MSLAPVNRGAGVADAASSSARVTSYTNDTNLRSGLPMALLQTADNNLESVYVMVHLEGLYTNPEKGENVFLGQEEGTTTTPRPPPARRRTGGVCE